MDQNVEIHHKICLVSKKIPSTLVKFPPKIQEEEEEEEPKRDKAKWRTEVTRKGCIHICTHR